MVVSLQFNKIYGYIRVIYKKININPQKKNCHNICLLLLKSVCKIVLINIYQTQL